MRRSPLEAWLAKKIGSGGERLSREQLCQYQQNQLRSTLAWVLERSPFYRRRMGDIAVNGVDIRQLWPTLPLTTEADLRRCGPEFLCLSQSEISRVVTLDTSGTNGPAKRLYFSPEDQAATRDFFAAGMSTLVERGDRVLILLSGDRPGSVGDLLAKALADRGVTAIPHGPVREPAHTLRLMRERQVTALVGVPVQVLALARWPDPGGAGVKLNSVLLSTDQLSPPVARAIADHWQCQVFDHYGMTEMGLGGGVDCQAHAGYHLRENDLYFEVVNPATGRPAAAGEAGEVVFTTLTRKGMPLIRYRTGDISRILTDDCPCGCALRRLERIAGRVDGRHMDGLPSLAELDNLLLAIPGVIDFSAEAYGRSLPPKLELALLVAPGFPASGAEVRRRLEPWAGAAANGVKRPFSLTVHTEICDTNLPQRTGKRRLVWMEDGSGDEKNLPA